MAVTNATERAERILEQRARVLARVPNASARPADVIEVAVCTVGSESFGFPVHLLREIVPLPFVTRLPFAPECLLGIAQVRGTLLSIFDMAKLSQVKGTSTPTHLVVVEAREGAVGFTVDEVLTCRHVSPSALQDNGMGPGERRAALGLTPDLVVIVDVPALLNLPELVIE
ncbi:MAG TPA: chemotaxis protein CheW [Polyangiaceae bacterium]